jgi:hypothetical protein
MGRISRSLARRRVFVGVLALGALALAACAAPPLKDEAPPNGGVGLPELCIPVDDPGGPVERFTAEADPDCLPICPPRDQLPPNQAFAQVEQRCVEIPVFCLPGQGGDPRLQIEPGEPVPQRCTPLCVLIPPGFPGACEEVPRETR